MVDTAKVFLLTPASPLGKKIVWADSDEDARLIADTYVFKRKEPGSEIPMISNGAYSEPTTTCEEVTSLIEDIQQFNNTTIHFQYLGKQIHLGKGKAELLNKFLNYE